MLVQSESVLIDSFVIGEDVDQIVMDLIVSDA